MKKSKPVNMNYAWSEVMVRELTRLGVTTFYVAPGSRSSPLALTAADFAKRMVVHFDERGVGFAALGHGRATGKPAVIITTSGSAVANLWPAVCEASTDGVPLIIISADRPPELRDTGANQTMDQVRIFGGYARWQVDLPCPDEAVPARFIVSSMDEAYARATGTCSGPVHINQMFREPLAPVTVEDGSIPWQAALGRWWRNDRSWTQQASVQAYPDVTEVRDLIAHAKKGVIVAGELRSGTDRKAVVKLADSLGWPVFPDIRSGLRLGPKHPQVMTMADQMLLSDKISKKLRPDIIVHCGGRIVSKRLMKFIAGGDIPYVMVHAGNTRIDPDQVVSTRINCSPELFVKKLLATKLVKPSRSPWLPTWRRYHEAVENAWIQESTGTSRLTEPAVAAMVSGCIPPHHALVLACSMPVRDMEMYGLAGRSTLELVSNRGVSGIDGTIATTCGYSEGAQRPVTLLIGDLALLHDLNSLALVAKSTRPITIVLINNDGGAIFSFLPVAASTRHYEKCFGAPHGLTFEAAATLFGLDYHQPGTMAEFKETYCHSLRQGRSTLIEVGTERGENLKEHRRIQQVLKDAAENA